MIEDGLVRDSLMSYGGPIGLVVAFLLREVLLSMRSKRENNNSENKGANRAIEILKREMTEHMGLLVTKELCAQKHESLEKQEKTQHENTRKDLERIEGKIGSLEKKVDELPMKINNR